jgi:hypothetical protein
MAEALLGLQEVAVGDTGRSPRCAAARAGRRRGGRGLTTDQALLALRSIDDVAIASALQAPAAAAAA